MVFTSLNLHFTVNTDRPNYKDQLFISTRIWRNKYCLLLESYGTHEYSVWGKCGVFMESDNCYSWFTGLQDFRRPTRSYKDVARRMISWPSTRDEMERARSSTRADESAVPFAVRCERKRLRSVRKPRRSSCARWLFCCTNSCLGRQIIQQHGDIIC